MKPCTYTQFGVAAAVIALLLAPTVALAAPTVGMDTLLHQETDLSTLPYLRDWSTHLQSSYDRSGGNGDAQHFLSMEGKTAVMADMDGPGAIVRIWSANPNGELKIYIDNSPTPVIDTPFQKLFDGSLQPFVAPLAQTSSGGFYSYIPIPYSTHCRVTVDNPQGLYYHVCYVTYKPGTAVRSFALPITSADQNALDAAVAAWKMPTPDLGRTVRDDVSAHGVVPQGRTADLARLQGPGTIRFLDLKPDHVSDASLRRLVLRVTFDSHKTPDVEVPLADLFGNAFGRLPVTSLLIRDIPNGSLQMFFPMPFARSARVSLENGSPLPVAITLIASLDKSPVDMTQEGYFHASWWQELTRYGVPHLWLKVKGERGHFVGIVQSMSSNDGLGFLEGDDQVRVDDQAWKPCYWKTTVIGPWNGTGTEDFFNSGWYFSGGPNSLDVNGALVRADDGRIDAYRWFINDAPVFQDSIDAQIEHGPENDDTPGVYYSSVAFWYSNGASQPWYKLPPASQIDPPSPTDHV